jgi:hypothetical protein
VKEFGLRYHCNSISVKGASLVCAVDRSVHPRAGRTFGPSPILFYGPGGNPYSFLDLYSLSNTCPKCIRLYANADHSTTQRTLLSPRTRNGPSPRYVRKSALTVSLVEALSL